MNEMVQIDAAEIRRLEHEAEYWRLAAWQANKVASRTLEELEALCAPRLGADGDFPWESEWATDTAIKAIVTRCTKDLGVTMADIRQRFDVEQLRPVRQAALHLRDVANQLESGRI